MSESVLQVAILRIAFWSKIQNNILIQRFDSFSHHQEWTMLYRVYKKKLNKFEIALNVGEAAQSMKFFYY